MSETEKWLISIVVAVVAMGAFTLFVVFAPVIVLVGVVALVVVGCFAAVAYLVLFYD